MQQTASLQCSHCGGGEWEIPPVRVLSRARRENASRIPHLNFSRRLVLKRAVLPVVSYRQTEEGDTDRRRSSVLGS